MNTGMKTLASDYDYAGFRYAIVEENGVLTAEPLPRRSIAALPSSSTKRVPDMMAAIDDHTPLLVRGV